MAVAFRAAGVFAAEAAGSISVAYPAGVASGDLLLIQFVGSNPSTASTPSGWTKLFGPTAMSGGNMPCYVFYKVAGGSEPSSVTVTYTGTSAEAVMTAYTGVDTTTPVNTSATATLVTGGNTSADTPSVTTTVANTMLVRVYWSWGGGPAGGSITPAGTDTERYEGKYVTGDVRMEAATSTQTSAGASGTTTATFFSNHFGGLGATIALAPATAVAPVADFTGTPLTGIAPLSVTFTDASTGTPTSWAWTFGDTGTSSSQNPTHSYTSPGVYTVALVATNAAGSDTKTRTGYVTVNSGFVPKVVII